jgi:hypothetical protein
MDADNSCYEMCQRVSGAVPMLYSTGPLGLGCGFGDHQISQWALAWHEPRDLIFAGCGIRGGEHYNNASLILITRFHDSDDTGRTLSWSVAPSQHKSPTFGRTARVT